MRELNSRAVLLSPEHFSGNNCIGFPVKSPGILILGLRREGAPCEFVIDFKLFVERWLAWCYGHLFLLFVGIDWKGIRIFIRALSTRLNLHKYLASDRDCVYRQRCVDCVNGSAEASGQESWVFILRCFVYLSVSPNDVSYIFCMLFLVSVSLGRLIYLFYSVSCL